MTNFFSRIRAREWAWVHYLAAIGLAWPLYMLVSPPDLVVGTLDIPILNLAMGISLFGTLVKIYGYLASQQPGTLGVVGVSVELVGLILSAVGPGTYLIIRAYLLFTPESIGISTALIFAYAICSVYLYRAIIIVPRFMKEAHDELKEL